MWNPGECLRDFRDWLVTSIGFIFAAIGGFALLLSGMLFNFLLDNTVAEFSSKIITGEVEAAINVAWEVFRDVANIVIIGMFTFIAISLILGIKEYGERKMIARVLIVAVLINFSLLFTKIIIDGSNFVAYQFYRAAQLETEGDYDEASFDTPPPGVAGAFLKSMGATGVIDLFDVLKATQQSEDGYSLKTIIFGIVIGVLLLLAAAVLLYGSFLMLARALLLIFLMITAPLAFASWLIPKFAQEGWHKWWDSLLKSAVFAPLLMLFLWVSIKLISGFQGNGTLGKLMSEEPGALALGTDALFRYLIVLGFLFASIKIASKFSGTIAGFGTVLGAAALPLTFASRGAAMAGRLTLGRWGARAAEGKEEALGNVRTRLADIGPKFRKLEERRKAGETLKPEELKNLEKYKSKYETGLQDATRLIRQKDRRESVAKSSFNAFNTQAGKALAAGMGLKGYAAGADKKPPSFAESAKAQAEKAAKTAAELSMSGADKEKLQMKKEKELREAQKGREEQLKAIREGAAIQKQEAEDAKKRAEAEAEARKPETEELQGRHSAAKETVVRITEDATRKKDDIRTRHDAEIENLRKQVSDLRESGGDTADLERTVGERVRTRDAQLKAEDDRINSARAAVETIQSRIDIIRKPVTDAEARLTEAESALKKAEKDIGEFNQNIVKDAKSAVEAIANQSKDVAKDVGAELAHQRWSNIIPRALGQSPDNDIIARKARGLTGKKIGAKTIKAQEAARKEILDDAGEGGKGGEKH